ncbi:MAG TPA: phosphonate ABC transporter permease [Chloroflexus aurantiacus]|uniref:Binding-protein-dependent transport systems inner membrane component n=1 Tax=Chloroflexus aurantiacus (strain ATCC 29366 / DSM 635 / J-10-fl) TaxID=324602 RepID=A9WG32_CHLAA|nr:ABC transporter permease subunit [Chloroflexus aurantiacus]ABY36186.1 binding-protein-dependent transport systems inner membrane component [Chloroflexus aurantiacus J-10-fl]HBW66412.1 phosphonate ABC transporter permease [Chloroflexus aurantiacus]
MEATQPARIRVRPANKANLVIQGTLIVLSILTIYGLLTLDTRNVDPVAAFGDMLNSFRIVFLEARLDNLNWFELLRELLITVCLGLLTTVFGAGIAFFLALIAAQNLAPLHVTNVVKAVMAFIRAVPTVLWVLFFAVTTGLGSVAAVIGMTFHSISYLVKAYAETFEELDPGILEALRACGANWWQTVFQAVTPSTASALLSWTFVRFEINFSVAIAMGAVAGAGGIGFDMFMASAFYLNLRELGMFTYAVLIFAILLEWGATHLKATVGKIEQK